VFRGSRLVWNNPVDYVLIQVDGTIDISVHTPICLPNLGDDFTQFSSVMTGWGINVSSTIDEETPFVNILQEITLPITTYDTCNTFVNTLIGNEQPVAYSGILCVGNGEEKGGCRGDSGGPIIVQKPGQTSWTLAGVISFGAAKCSAEDTYTVGVDVAFFMDFINSNINDGDFCAS